MKTEIADCETDGYLASMTKIWTIQIGDANSDEVTIYADQPGYPSLEEGAARLKRADRVVFHNGMRFDLFAINRFFPGTIDPRKLFDTMVAARMLFPNIKTHTLKDWGVRTGTHKGEYTGDFQKFDQELVDYAGQDIVTGRALFNRVIDRLDKWGCHDALNMEFLFQYCMALQEQNGFMLDVPKARELEAELRQELADISIQLQEAFPPRFIPKGGTPKKAYRKNKVRPKIRGNPVTTQEPGKKKPQPVKAYEQPYCAIELQEFSASSRQQAADRLMQRYGWKPKKYTEAGQPQLDEDVLSNLKYPEAKLLLKYLTVEKQLGQLANKAGDKGWLVYVDEKTNRVHGAVNTLGAGTGRCTHFRPNMAQVNKKNKRMREVWIPRPGWKLVGIDADGIEFCCLAHYMHRIDGGATTKKHLEGDKKKGTDVHSSNRDAVIKALRECYFITVDPHFVDDYEATPRDYSKTILYAMMYGSGDPGLGMTIIEMLKKQGIKPPASPKDLGALARKAVGEGTKGLDQLIKDVGQKAKQRRWLKGIDGRRIFIKSDYSAFNFLLQGAGAIAMKMALVIFHFEKVEPNGWVHGRDFAYCANVHDEVQIEAKPEIAQEIGDTFAECITLAGERLGFRCPLSGSADVGDSWAATH